MQTRVFSLSKYEEILSRDERFGFAAKELIHGEIRDDVAFLDLFVLADSGARGQTARKQVGEN